MSEEDIALIGKTSILYIEDDESTRKSVSQLLERRARKIYIARHGVSGVEIFKESGDHIDVVITDVRMPLLDGNDMITKIKAINPNVKIVAITAYPYDIENRDQFDQVLSKPVDRDELFEAIVKAAPNYLK